MNTEHLKEFLILTEIGNYASAADQLFISQASLSRHIIALENELGAKLFNRYPRYIELTNAGMAFLPFAKRMVNEDERCLNELSDFILSRRPLFSIGMDSIAPFYGVTELINKFKSSHPELNINISVDDSSRMKERVIDGKVHAAFILSGEPVEDENLRSVRIFKDILSVIVPDSSGLSGLSQITKNDIYGEDLFLPPPFTTLHELCSRALIAPEQKLPRSASADPSGFAAIDLVSRLQLTAILPSLVAHQFISESFSCIPFVPKTDIFLSLIVRRDPSDRAQEFFNFFKATEENPDEH